MKENRLFTTICLMAAILFTACTQDELAEQGTALPDGEYPLQIGSTTSTHNEGSPTAGTTQGWLKMKSTTYTDGTKCWEANVVPGAITLSNFIRLNGTTVVTDLTGLPTTLEEGTMYTVNMGGLNSYWKRNLYDKRVQRVLAHSVGRSKDARK